MKRLKIDEAIRNIYFEAGSAGYTASAFWSMFQSDGALNTARRLALAPRRLGRLHPAISVGTTRFNC